MKKINFNICYWNYHDVDNRKKNTEFSWNKLKKFIEFSKINSNLDISAYLFDLSPEKKINDAIHIPVTEKTYERSKKINLCLEYNYLHNKPDIICFLDSDVFFEEDQYNKFINILNSFDKKNFYTSRVLDIQDNSEVNFESLKINEDINFIAREIPGLGAFFLIDFDSLFNIGGFDERFKVWGGEDDDLRERLIRLGLTRKNMPIALFHLKHDTNLIHEANVVNATQKQKQLDIMFNDKSVVRETILSKYNLSNFKEVNSIDLLTTNRFDINAKLIYAKNILKNLDLDYSKKIYLEHIKVWNNFFELNPKKEKSEDFINSFNELINSMSKNGFCDHEKNYIPTKNSSPYNGAHRVASAIALNKKLITKEDCSNGQYDCGYSFFRKKGLSIESCDEMALEFVRNKKNTYVVNIFGNDTKDVKFTEEILNKNFNILYTKDIEFTDLGKHNYTIMLYKTEKWIGNFNNYFEGALGKSNMCFDKSNKLKLYIVETNNPELLKNCKLEIRKYYNRENHSIHINDTYEETWKICSTLLNKNSLSFLNNNRIPSLLKFNNLFQDYKLFLRNEDTENFCLTSSAVLSLYSLRECNDLDYFTISINEKFDNFKSNSISSHKSELKYYSKSKEEIIFDPKNYLYYDGLKFASLDIIYKMKKKRDELKDIKDCLLIETVLEKIDIL